MNGEVGRRRLGLIAICALSLFGALFARLWFLQIVEGSSLDAQVNRNSTRVVAIPAPRGRILDRNGEVLVDNRQSIVVAIDTQKLKDLGETEGAKMLADLARVLSEVRPSSDAVTAKFLTTRLNDSRFDRLRPVPVVENATPEDEVYLREESARFPAVVVQRQTVRRYRFGSLAAHVLGYVGPLADNQWNDPETGFKDHNDATKPYAQTDDIGKAGVEQRYEHDLRGTPGKRVYRVDRNNRVIGEIRSERIDVRTGDDLYLSIDAKVQYKAEAALQGRLVASKSKRPAGALVVLDPSNGQVRAMASYPTYNPADLVGGISCPVWRDLQGLARDGSCTDVDAEVRARPKDDKPISRLLNRATQGAYPPASTYKLATAYAALKLGMITPEKSIDDPGSYRLCDGNGRGCLKRNAGNQPHGSVDLRKALTVSSDVYFYKIGDESWKRREELGDDGLQRYMKELGYGSRTGIDLPAESSGLVPTPGSEAEAAKALYQADPEAYGNDPAQAVAAGRWRGGFSADLAIGQKVVTTPLQIANAYASLANGGTLWTPSVLDRITAAGQPDKIKRQFQKKAIRTIDWGDARETFVEGFTGVVDPTGQLPGGTAVGPFKGFPFSQFPLAGKTGTAQTANKKVENSLFVGFSLGDPSQWTAAAMLEGAGAGARSAAPAVRLVLDPIATGEIADFEIPEQGNIDAKAVAAQSAGIDASGTD